MSSSYRHGGFADVQISRHACKHPRVLPNAACFCPALGLVEHRDGMASTTITTHPTHPAVAHSAGPAKRGQSSKDRHGEAGEDARARVAIRSSATLLIEQMLLIYCSNARRLQCFTLLLALFCVIAHLACRDSNLTMHHGSYAVECDSGILLRLSATEWSAPHLGLDNARQQQFAHPVLLKRAVLSLPS
jgi:hypothetical protein